MRRMNIVMLPGLLCDGAVWAAQREALVAADAESFVADYGLAASITTMAQQVLDEAPGGKLCVIAHSMGGRVGLEMARLAPQRIARIALMDTGYQPLGAGAAGEAEARGRRALLQIAHERGMREMGRQWARGMVHPSRMDTPLFEQVLAMIERKSPAIFEAQVRALLARPDATPVLEALRCPTLLLCGREDTWSPLARHQEMHALVRGSELVVVEGSGHMAPMEQPDAVNAGLLSWLSTRPRLDGIA